MRKALLSTVAAISGMLIAASAYAQQSVIDGKVFWYAPMRQNQCLLVTIQQDGQSPVVVDDPINTYAAAWPVGTPQYQAVLTAVAAAASTGGHITLTFYPGSSHVSTLCGPNPYSGTFYSVFGSLAPVKSSGPVNVYGPNVNKNSPP